MRRWLVDTGPLVAYLDADDPSHRPVADALERFTGRVVTTGAVVTEAMHFVQGLEHGPRRLAELLGAGEVEIIDVSRPVDLLDAAALMERYENLPMDFADATLVLVAEGIGVLDVLTLDRRGFSAYRTRRGRQFRIVLDR